MPIARWCSGLHREWRRDGLVRSTRRCGLCGGRGDATGAYPAGEVPRDCVAVPASGRGSTGDHLVKPRPGKWHAVSTVAILVT